MVLLIAMPVIAQLGIMPEGIGLINSPTTTSMNATVWQFSAATNYSVFAPLLFIVPAVLLGFIVVIAVKRWIKASGQT